MNDIPSDGRRGSGIRRRTVILAVVILLAAAAGGWFAWQWRAGPRVAVAEVRRGPAVEAVYATATVEPVRWGKIGPLEPGRLTAIEAEEGDRVARGDVLARLDAAEQEAELAELQADIRFLRAELDRITELAARGVVSSKVAEQAQSALDRALAEIAGAEQRLERRVLRAPLDGMVLRRDFELGEIVGPDDTVFCVGQPVPLRAVAEVDEEDIPRVAAGQPVLITADAFPGRALPGTIAEITPMGDPVLQSYRVRIALPDDTPLMVSMTVEVNIVTRRDDDALLIPDTALVATPNSAGVYVVAADGTARLRRVETGVIGDGSAEVLSGLEAGERVIVRPPAGLADGAAVRPLAEG